MCVAGGGRGGVCNVHMPCWMIVVVTAVCGSKLPLILQGFVYFSFWIANGDDFSCQYFQLQECSLLCRSSEYRTLPQYPTVLKKVHTLAQKLNNFQPPALAMHFDCAYSLWRDCHEASLIALSSSLFVCKECI